MRSDLRSMPALESRARWARALTAAVASAAVAFFVLAVLYAVRPAEVMPPLVPGLSISSSGGHRYRLAATCFVFALMLTYITVLRWRLQRRVIDLTVPHQRAGSLLLERRGELTEEPDDGERAVEHQIGARS